MCTHVLLAISTWVHAYALPQTDKQHTGTHWNTLDHTLEYTGTHWNTLQHTAKHCNTLEHTATHNNNLRHTVTTHCNTLLCDTLQQSAIHLWTRCLYHANTATHCNTMQPKENTVATIETPHLRHANTLQHAATHGNTSVDIWKHTQHTATYCNWTYWNTFATSETPYLRLRSH